MRVRLPLPRLVLLSALSAFAGGALVASVGHAEKRDASPHAAIEQLARVLVIVENRYVDPVDRARLLAGAIKGMVAELDPHSEYFPPKEYAAFAGETQGKFGGVGLEVEAGAEYLTIVSPIEGGPAEAAGLRAGDQIVAIDGQDARGLSLEKAVTKMRGDAGTKVEITIRRPSEAKVFRVPLVRSVIHVPSVEAWPLPSGVVYLRLRQFQERTRDELLDQLGKVRGKLGVPIAGVVLDMRRNPGGLVDQAVGVADEFLDSGIIFSTRGQTKDSIEETKATSGGALTKVPVVVLVDEGSASAAELVAGALQDSKRATIVGQPTFGKGSVQTIIELPDGAGLKITTARYYTPSGRAIQAQGIEPDVLVEASRTPVPPAPFPKEKDLVGALPPELGAGGDAGVPSAPSAPAAASSSAPSAPTAASSSAPNAPSAPSRAPDLEKDFQLKMGFQIVTGVLMKKR